MSKDRERLECESHGPAYMTFVCQHLTGGSTALGFHFNDSSQAEWPDAWCDACDAVWEAEGELTERVEKQLGIKLLCHFCYEQSRALNMVIREPAEYRAFVDESIGIAKRVQARLNDELGLRDHKKYFWDQNTGKIEFFSGGRRLVAQFRIVGSFSTASDTWLWGWANDSLREELTKDMHRVRSYGAERGWDRFTVSLWPAEEVDGWEMACVACRLLDGEGMYRAPSESGALFFVLTDVVAVAD